MIILRIFNFGFQMAGWVVVGGLYFSSKTHRRKWLKAIVIWINQNTLFSAA